MTRRAAVIAALVASFGITAAVAIALWPDRDATDGHSTARAATPDPPQGLLPDDSLAPPAETAEPEAVPSVAEVPDSSSFALEEVPTDPPVQPRLKRPPAGGVLFDVDSGEVLWARDAEVPRPMASLTKMLTALMVAEASEPGDEVPVSYKAGHAPGSATGLLPEGKSVPLEALLQALMMISANDAAVALAEHHSGSVAGFIAAMNGEGERMGLDCSHFNTPNGLKDLDNYSCPLDLAALARADLANARIARIARTRSATPAFPIKGGTLHLANNHYFLTRGLRDVPGARVTGLKTGLTDAAGRCYVTTARLGSSHLGVVLLDSPDPLRQVPLLLRAGFAATGEIHATSQGADPKRAGRPAPE